MKHISFLLIIFSLMACQRTKKEGDPESLKVSTPVSITTVENTSISEYIYLNATSVYLKKNQVKATTGGYIQQVYINVGDFIEAGKPMFSIITKEAEALGKHGRNDSLFNLKGVILIKAPSSGIVTEVDKHLHDYLTDGDLTAVIADQSSFVFQLNVPFEYNKYAALGTLCSIVLPDSTEFTGKISTKLSSIDAVSQTQSYIVKPQVNRNLPENLLVIVKLNKNTHVKAQILNKTCILSDETLEHFWVMKLINDSTAVKINITKGISNDHQVEVISPVFLPGDRFISEGHYGLPDTAIISIRH